MKQQLFRNIDVKYPFNLPIPQEFTEKELKAAYFYWMNQDACGFPIKRYVLDEIDKAVEAFLNPNIKSHLDCKWLKDSRTALHLSMPEVARRLGVSRQTYSGFENAEASGAITLKNLKKVAAAMDCELVYAIRPKTRQKFSEMIWQQMVKTLKHHGWLRKCNPHRKAGGLAALARQYEDTAQFKKILNWNERSQTQKKP